MGFLLSPSLFSPTSVSLCAEQKVCAQASRTTAELGGELKRPSSAGARGSHSSGASVRPAGDHAMAGPIMRGHRGSGSSLQGQHAWAKLSGASQLWPHSEPPEAAAAAI